MAATQQDRFVSWSLDELVPGDPLPASCYLHLDHRFVRYRLKGDLIDRVTFDRMVQKGVSCVFVKHGDLQAMQKWLEASKLVNETNLPVSEELKEARQDAHRSMMDIFHSNHSNQAITKTLKASENLVTELMKFPFAAKSLSQLQTYSRGTVDHSVNVSVLSVYLAINMGYSHVLILRHIAAGALLHDIGKSQIKLEEQDSPEQTEVKLQKHPELAAQMLRDDETVSKEVRMIVAQHHEHHDGSGFPRGLKGKEIYDLAKIVAIANTFDGLVSEGKGSLEQRQKVALEQLQGPLSVHFDPNKLQKALKILSLGV